MQAFEFNCTTRVIFGKDTQQRVGGEIQAWGGTKVLVHYGSASARKNGLLDQVEQSLKEAGIPYVLLGGVVPNPLIELVREGVELCRKEGVDFLLGVGGGSVIDSLKAIGFGAKYDGDVWDIYDGCTKKPITQSLPIGSIVTIAAAGSETSSSSVLTNGALKRKRGYKSEICRPKFAIMNPELTYTLPAYQTSCGIVDILLHTFERYFSPRAENQMSDLLAEAVLRNTIANGRLLLEEPNNYKYRSEILWAGNLSHNDLTGLGYTGDWGSHQIEHELGGMFDVAHGAGLAAIWASWARYVYKADIMRFVQFANKVWDIEINYNNYEETALAGIKATEAYFTSIQMPTSIRQLIGRSLTEDEVAELSASCVHFGKRTIGQFKKLGKEDVAEIYRMAQ
ncbi:MAG: iron-containing alcohol dehydrogenase [Clostridiales bacterium]